MTKCNYRASIGDDYGDNSCTFPCKLEKDHKEEYHQQKFTVGKHEFIVQYKEVKE